MNGDLEFPVNKDGERSTNRDAKSEAAQDGLLESRSIGTARYRMERRSSYCAETAWVWQRARFLCAQPQ